MGVFALFSLLTETSRFSMHGFNLHSKLLTHNQILSVNSAAQRALITLSESIQRTQMAIASGVYNIDRNEEMYIHYKSSITEMLDTALIYI